MDAFRYWLDAIRGAGIWLPVDVGIMPILDQAATINMALSRNGCVMDRKLCEIISKNWIFPNPFDKEPFDADVAGKKASFKAAGIEYRRVSCLRRGRHPPVRAEQVRRRGQHRKAGRSDRPRLIQASAAPAGVCPPGHSSV